MLILIPILITPHNYTLVTYYNHFILFSRKWQPLFLTYIGNYVTFINNPAKFISSSDRPLLCPHTDFLPILTSLPLLCILNSGIRIA